MQWKISQEPVKIQVKYALDIKQMGRDKKPFIERGLL